MWAVEIDDEEPAAPPALADAIATGGRDTHAACRKAARTLRARGATRLDAPSAALVPGGAHGHVVDAGLRRARPRDGRAIVLYGARPSITGWRVAHEGRPADDLLERVRHF